MTGGRRQLPTGLVAALASVPVAPAVWWWCGWFRIGHEETGDDYLYRPIDLPAAIETAIGATATVLVAVAVVVLVRRIRSGSADSRWWRATAPSALAAAYIGFTYHAVTAPVSGANIGGTGLLMASPVMVLPLMAIAISQVLRIQHR